MHRFYAEEDPNPEGLYPLSPEDARHALTVLRLKAGQQVELIRDGLRYQSVIDHAGKNEVLIRPMTSLPSTEPALSITLYQGLPKGEKMDWIVQKATELGVASIVPVMMERSVSRPSAADMERKRARWNKIAREAGKQSGRCRLPEVTGALNLSELAESRLQPAVKVVPWEEAVGFGPLALRDQYPGITSLGILIGPEGGISPAEIRQLEAEGFLPMTLGKRILRAETASVAAIAAMMCLWGEMETA